MLMGGLTCFVGSSFLVGDIAFLAEVTSFYKRTDGFHIIYATMILKATAKFSFALFGDFTNIWNFTPITPEVVHVK